MGHSPSPLHSKNQRKRRMSTMESSNQHHTRESFIVSQHTTNTHTPNNKYVYPAEFDTIIYSTRKLISMKRIHFVISDFFFLLET